MKKMTTAREMRFIVKSAIDAAVEKLFNEYGADAFTSKTVAHVLETEAAAAIRELTEGGEILSLREREGWGTK